MIACMHCTVCYTVLRCTLTCSGSVAIYNSMLLHLSHVPAYPLYIPLYGYEGCRDDSRGIGVLCLAAHAVVPTDPLEWCTSTNTI